MNILTNVYGTSAEINLLGVAISMIASIVLGGALANVYWGLHRKTNSTKGFAITLALLPVLICMLVLLLSSNFGAGIAVAGAFALIKFKSAAGTAKEIIAIFISISFGIACGMGYILLAVVFAVIVLGIFSIYTKAPIWDDRRKDFIKIMEVDYKSEEDRDKVQAIMDEIADSRKIESIQATVKKGKAQTKYIYRLSFSNGDDDKKLVEKLINGDASISFKMTKYDKSKVNRL